MSGIHHAVLGLVAQTSLHAGSGESDHVIDLPIQREAHTDWPCVYGSGVKGALRARADQLFASASVDQVFGPGPDSDKAHEHAGALMVGDARLLLLPVRSLNSHFRWVTCPAILRRLGRDLQRLGLDGAGLAELPLPAPGEAIVASARGSDLYLEEYRFSQQEQALDGLLETLARLLDGERQAELRAQLTLVDDDAFRHLCRAATPVQTHVRIDNATKTVAGGALWTEESLPPETLLYTHLSATGARDGSGMTAADLLLSTLDGLFKDQPFLQVGGNETVGMGWCAVRIWRS